MIDISYSGLIKLMKFSEHQVDTVHLNRVFKVVALPPSKNEISYVLNVAEEPVAEFVLDIHKSDNGQVWYRILD